MLNKLPWSRIYFGKKFTPGRTYLKPVVYLISGLLAAWAFIKTPGRLFDLEVLARDQSLCALVTPKGNIKKLNRQWKQNSQWKCFEIVLLWRLCLVIIVNNTKLRKIDTSHAVPVYYWNPGLLLIFYEDGNPVYYLDPVFY